MPVKPDYHNEFLKIDPNTWFLQDTHSNIMIKKVGRIGRM
jgi:hypothetical protein